MISPQSLCKILDQKLGEKFALIVLAPLLALTSCASQRDSTYQSGGMTHTFAAGKAAIPKDFDKLVYPEAATTGSVSAEGDNDQEQSKFLMLSSSDPTDQISKWYQEQLKAASWSVDKVETASKIVSISGHKSNLEINVMIAQEGPKTSISLSLGKQLEGSTEEKDSTETYTPDKVIPPTD
jgi:hypothetical protein